MAWPRATSAALGRFLSKPFPTIHRGDTDMRSLALAVLLAGISSTAFAADPHINNSRFLRRRGYRRAAAPDSNKSTFTMGVATAELCHRQETWRFTARAGARAARQHLSGCSVRTASLTSTGRGNHEGEIMGDQLDCWTDNVEKYVGSPGRLQAPVSFDELADAGNRHRSPQLIVT